MDVRMHQRTVAKANRWVTLTLICAVVVTAGIATAGERIVTDIGVLDAETVAKPFKSSKTYSPAAAWNYPSRVYWGDTHLHTSASMDAGAFGNRLGFEEAYRFARGEEVTSSTRPARASSRGRSTSSRSPITPTTWAFSRTCSPENARSSPTRPANAGTTW